VVVVVVVVVVGRAKTDRPTMDPLARATSASPVGVCWPGSMSGTVGVVVVV